MLCGRLPVPILAAIWQKGRLFWQACLEMKTGQLLQAIFPIFSLLFIYFTKGGSSAVFLFLTSFTAMYAVYKGLLYFLCRQETDVQKIGCAAAAGS